VWHSFRIFSLVDWVDESAAVPDDFCLTLPDITPLLSSRADSLLCPKGYYKSLPRKVFLTHVNTKYWKENIASLLHHVFKNMYIFTSKYSFLTKPQFFLITAYSTRTILYQFLISPSIYIFSFHGNFRQLIGEWSRYKRCKKLMYSIKHWSFLWIKCQKNRWKSFDDIFDEFTHYFTLLRPHSDDEGLAGIIDE
jgi:hypothetical protein